jgi:predicted RNA-binding Zn ribbon-like protein
MPTPPTLYAKSPLPRAPGQSGDIPLVGGHLALDFLNSTPHHAAHDAADLLAPGYVNVLDWAAAAGVIAAEEIRPLTLLAGKEPREAAAVRRRLVALRAEAYPVVLALVHGERPDSSLTVLNQEVMAAHTARQLVLGPGSAGWGWRQSRSLERPLWDIALAIAEVLLQAGHLRIRQCDAPACERFFLDTSRNGLRRYCSASGCGTVERVRRFRQRQRES